MPRDHHITIASPDLTALSAAHASALEQIAGAAAGAFIHRVDEAVSRARKGLTDKARHAWIAQAEAEEASARRLLTAARAFQKAASRRAREAEREECVAIRVIGAFAEKAMRPAAMRVAA